MDIYIWFLLLGLGSIAGFLSGLLGIGGGILIVPSLYYLFISAGLHSDISIHLALGTSLACVIFISLASTLNHYKRNNIDLNIAKPLLPGILFGSFLGSLAVNMVPSQYIKISFGFIIFYLGLVMLFTFKSQKKLIVINPCRTFFKTMVIGSISTLAGIGGGSLIVPYLNRQGVDMRKSISTASVCAAALACMGTIGFIYNGLGMESLPKWSFGYIYLPAFFTILASSIFTSSWGVKASQILPVKYLKISFALFLLIMGLKFIIPNFI